VTKREPTPAEKGQATRERNLARKAQAAKSRALNAPVRQAWKDLRAGLKMLAIALRPVSVWTVRARGPNIAAAQRERDIADARARVERLVVAWDTAKTEVAATKRAANRQRKARA
jgi:hypothetical protein